jgi:F-box associated protein
MKRLRDQPLENYYQPSEKRKKEKKTWSQRSLLEYNITWERSLSPLEQLPPEVIVHIHSYLPLFSRVDFQRVCQKVYEAAPGLFLPLSLEPWRHVLPLEHHDHLQRFLHEVIYAGLPWYEGRRLLRVLDIMPLKREADRCQGRGWTIEEANYAAGTWNVKDFCLALEYEASAAQKKEWGQSRLEVIMASDSTEIHGIYPRGHAWRHDRRIQTGMSVRHVPSARPQCLLWESRTISPHCPGHGMHEAWYLQELLQDVQFFEQEGDEPDNCWEMSMDEADDIDTLF